MQALSRENMVREGRDVIEGLSEEQRAAVAARTPRTLVSAGAGAGKTRVLTARFLQRLAEGLDLDEVAAVTFTEKAAGELKRRIREGLVRAGRPDDARRVPDAWVSTIHGLCRRLLREHGFDAGVDPGSKVLNEHEALVLAEEAFEAAAEALIEERDPDVLAVLEAIDIASTAKHVLAAHGQAVAAGLDPTAVASQPPVDPGELRRIAGALRRAADEMLGFKETKSRDYSVEQARRLADAIERVSQEVVADAQSALAVLGEIEPLGMRAQGTEEFKAVVYEAKALRETAQALLVQAACAQHERGLAKLVARFAREYARAKREAGAMDFDDLQTHVAALLRAPVTSSPLAGRFAEVMVDEYQDTNPLQACITEALARESLVAVGDKRQSIYRFRYADVRVFERFARSAEVKALTENWRSHADLLAVVNRAFSSPALFGDDHQVLRAAQAVEEEAWPDGEPRIKVLLAVADESKTKHLRRAEAEAVAAEVQRLQKEVGVRAGDIAILSRVVTDRAALFEDALRARGIEAACSAGNLFETPEAEDGLMLLRAIDNVLDDEAIVHVLSGSVGGLGPDAILRLREAGGAHGLWRGLEQAETVLQPPERERAQAVREAVRAGRRFLGAPQPGRALLAALRASGHEAALEARGAAGAQALENLRLLARLVDESDETTGRGIHGFITEADALKASGAIQVVAREGADAVRIMSIHAAKGLEFPVVFVVGLTERDGGRGEQVLVDCDGSTAKIVLGRPFGQEVKLPVPSAAFQRLAEENERQEHEEAKRLLYVAMTRAKQALVLSGFLGSEGSKPSVVNQALFDALGVDLEPGSGKEEAVIAGVRVPIVRRAVAAEAARSGAAPAAAGHRPQGPRHPGAPGLLSLNGARAALCRRVSPSALEDFERCPYRYYARHALGLRDPLEDAGATAFGTAVHAALQHVVMDTWSAARRMAVARRHGLEPADAGRLDEAVTALSRSSLLERIRRHGRVLTEAPFGVAVDDALLVGRMDVLAESDGRSLVVDFKSHSPGPAGGEPEAATPGAQRFERQMRCYALAALAGGARSVETVVYDVDTGAVSASWTFEAGQRVELVEELRTLLGQIDRSDFAPRDRYEHETCVGCPALGGLCCVRGSRRAAGAGRMQR